MAPSRPPAHANSTFTAHLLAWDSLASIWRRRRERCRAVDLKCARDCGVAPDWQATLALTLPAVTAATSNMSVAPMSCRNEPPPLAVVHTPN
jgi:hypothetical protein